MTPSTLTPIAAATGGGEPPEVHAFLAPSSAHRWRHCSAAPWMESQFPDLSDEAARREGTACHWVMLARLTVGPTDWYSEGSTTPNGVEVTRAMLDGVELLAQDIESKLGPQWQQLIQVERPVAIPRVHATANWGTPDVRAWVQKNGVWWFYIWDLKYGFKRVEVFENDQLVNYAAGCFSEAKLDSNSSPFVSVSLNVVQPRAYHPDGPVREWVTTANGLGGQIDALALAADEATGPAPVCRPRPDGCENCRARSGCDALQEAVYRGMDIARQAVPRVMTDAAMGLELATLEDVEGLLKARKSGLEEVIKARLSSGNRVPHWKYAPGQGSTKWKRPAAEVRALGLMFKKDLAKPLEVITPNQAMAGGLPEEYLRPFIETVSGAVKLTRSTDADARRIFTKTNT